MANGENVPENNYDGEEILVWAYLGDGFKQKLNLEPSRGFKRYPSILRA